MPGGGWALMLMGGYNLGTKCSCGVVGIGVGFWELRGFLLTLAFVRMCEAVMQQPQDACGHEKPQSHHKFA